MAPRAQTPPPPRVEPDGKTLCAVVGRSFLVPVCREPIDEKIAARRSTHEVLFREGGRIVKQESRNSSGALQPNGDGTAIRLWLYDGDRLREEVLQNADGHVLYRVAYAEGGKATYLDRHGRKKAPFGDRDAVGYLTTFDDRGHSIETRYVDAKGEPSTGGEQVFLVRNKYDARGRIVGVSYHQADGRPMLDKRGYHAIDIENVLDCERAFRVRGLDGRRVIASSGHSGMTRVCDEAGRAMSLRYLGVNDEPRVDVNGVAGWDAVRDDRGNLIERTYVGRGGAPSAGHLDRAIERFEYDRDGRQIAEHHLAADGTPAPVVRTSVASFRRTYDAAGRELTESLRGVTGRPQKGFSGWAVRRHVRNAFGQIKRTDYLDEEERPIRTNDGYASITYVYDALDQVVETWFRGVDGRLAQNALGYAIEKTTYSDDGQPSGHTYLDQDDAPVKIARGKYILVKHTETGAGSKIRTREQALALAQQALERLRAGEPWKLVAPQMSDVSDWRDSAVIPARAFPAIKTAVAATKPGAVTDVIDTPNGYFLYLLDP